MSKLRQQHMSIMWHDLSDKDSDKPSVSSPLVEKSALIGRVGLMYLESGAGAFRVRAAMNKLARALGITFSADIGLTALEYTVIDSDKTCTNALSNRSTGVNTTRLHYLEIFCDGFAERVNRYSVDDFHRMLDTIEKSGGNYGIWQMALASGFACAAFAFLLGAGTTEILCALLAAAAGFFIRKILLQKHITLFANVGAAVLSSCFVYISLFKLLSCFLSVTSDFRAGFICSILFVVPGFPLITGGIDLAKLDLRSGIERITYALLTVLVAALTCAFTASILKFSPDEFDPYELSLWLKWVLRFVASFIGVYGFSVIFNSFPKMAAFAGLIGSVSNLARLFLTDIGFSTGVAAFIGSLIAGLLASFARKYIGFPRITVTVPSIVIMVPGMFMYKGVYFMLAGDFNQGAAFLCRAMVIVISLPLGLVFARILTDKNFRTST